jgi:hypothetical protein
LQGFILISYSRGNIEYEYYIDGTGYHYSSPYDDVLYVESFSFFKKINENSSLYSFKISIGGIAGEGICYYDTMQSYYTGGVNVFYVNYTGNGEL